MRNLSSVVDVDDNVARVPMVSSRLHRAEEIRTLNVKRVLPALVASTLSMTIWSAADSLSSEGRMVLIILMLAVVGWTMTELSDTAVAVAAAIALAISGVIDSDDLYRSLGQELIWLMLAAFLMSAVLRSSGLIERCLITISSRKMRIDRLFYALSMMVAATAFIIPSTSGRAAMLLPVFVVLAAQLKKRPYVRALALLFPTVILLSACGSLIGAGAHLIAVEIINAKSGHRIGFLEWAALTLPFALLSSVAATWLVLRLFLNAKLRSRTISIARPAERPLTITQLLIAATFLITVTLWVLQPWHGIGIGIIAITGAFAMLHVGQPLIKGKDAFKAIEVELIVFLSATFVVADALIESGVDTWMANQLFALIPSPVLQHNTVVAGVVVAVSLAAHLVVTSRTARASVLLPAVVLSLAGFGHDLMTLVLASIVGTGFCQTMTASSKPVALYACADLPTYTNGDLMRLSGALLPMMFVLIMVFAIFVWPDAGR